MTQIHPPQTRIMQQYHTLKAQHPECLLFFRMGDFYELLYEDAKVAAHILGIVLTARRYKGNSVPIPMCGVPFHALEPYLARLVKLDYHVAICEQVGEDPGEKNLKHRQIVRIVTPGTLVEEGLLEHGNHFLMAIFPHGDLLGIALVDLSTGTFWTHKTTLEDLPQACFRFDPKEILFPESLQEHETILKLEAQWRTKLTPIPETFFRGSVKRLETFFKVQTIRGFGDFTPAELSAAGAVVEYLYMTQKREDFALERPQPVQDSLFLHMDAFTRRNLELTKTFEGDRKGSLLWVMDRTKTPMGSRLLSWRLHHPLNHPKEIEERLDTIAYFLEHPGKCGKVRDLLSSLGDVERSLSRLLLRRSTPRDFEQLIGFLEQLPILKGLIWGDVATAVPLELQRLELDTCEPLLHELKQALVRPLPSTFLQEECIRRGYSQALDALRVIGDEGENTLQHLQEKYLQETGISHLRIRHNHIIGYYIEVSTTASQKVPFYFQLKQSLTTVYRYTTPELHAWETRMGRAGEEVRALEAQILESLFVLCGAYEASLRSAIKTLAVYDVGCGLAHLAQEFKYVRPRLEETKAFYIEEGRHPVMEASMQRGNYTGHAQHVVTNPCSLTPPVMLLTGPNMAGKSTYLRQNALIAIMAHMGSFVPAKKATIGLIDRVFTRVGANDNLEKGQSTFMVEMVETATILHTATSKSLVVLDEIGRGTATYDGMALALSCLEYFAKQLACRTLFATHYHELTLLEALPQLSCYTFEIQHWNEDLIFLHKVIPGRSKGSYGIHAAKLAGVPEPILKRAQSLLTVLEKQSGGMDNILGLMKGESQDDPIHSPKN